MKLCKNCDSDLLKKRDFFLIKLLLAAALLLLPIGIYIWWLPFLIASDYICKKCGEIGKPKDVDWRELVEVKNHINIKN